ncbi:MAG TPA: type II toxin-antitoxin system antitoxin, RelB/DinJ family [Desulfobacteraceae bacterium]|nr:type II toxin-antitoxin system antitoxin, RelB/DinJ family [Desulfobacteraceae bacterium]
MMEQASISVRIESGLKAEAEGIFSELGISITEAISLFYQYVKQNKELPFEVRNPNKTTLKTFQDTDAGRNIVRCKDAEEMFEKLGI